ncbi:MAG: GNAT family N-acetyltransferase [Desulfobulbia bacterium]
MLLRHYQSSDTEFIGTLMIRSITELGSRYYNDRQIQAWLSKVPTPHQFDQFCTDGRHVILAANEFDRPLAFMDMEDDGHIDHLYCSPEFTGQGLATRIYSSVKQLAREQMMTGLFIEASEVVLPFFRNKGFTIRSRRKFEIGEVKIHNYSVEKFI